MEDFGKLEPASVTPARPVLAATAVVVGMALTAYLARAARRPTADSNRRDRLVAYLRDHLTGSDVAIRVVRELATSNAGTLDGRLSDRLTHEFEEERSIVRSLLAQLGASARSPKRAGGYTSGLLLSTVTGGEPGELSLLRTLEALAIGIQGKRCLWRALHALGGDALLMDVDLAGLESQAIRQWEMVEARRRALVIETFPGLGPRTHAAGLS